MEYFTDIVPILLFVITALLTVLGFFLKQLYSVIQGLTDSVNGLKISLESVRLNNRSTYDLFKQITDEHGKRIDHLQRKVDQYDQNMNEFWRKLPDAIKQQMS